MKTFPIHSAWNYSKCPESVAWSALEPFEDQALKNHYQTLEILARRGGLDPSEIWAIVNRQDWFLLQQSIGTGEMVRLGIGWISQHQETTPQQQGEER